MNEERLAWEHDVRLLTDRFVMGDVVRVFTLALVISQALVGTLGWIMDGEFIWFPPVMLAATSATLTFLVVIACLMLGNRARVVFAVGPKGAEWHSSDRERRLGALGVVAGVLAANPTAAGSSLLASSRADVLVPWDAVRRVTGYPGEAVIELRDSWHVALRIWCSPELYPVVLAACERYAAQAQGRRGELGTGPYTPWHVRVGWAVATIALASGAVAWAWDDDVTHRAFGLAAVALAASCLGDGVVRRLGGAVGLVASLWYAGYVAFEAVDPIVGPSGVYYGRTWELDTGVLAVSAASILGLLALAAWRLFGPPPSV